MLEVAVAKLMRAATDYCNAVSENPIVDALNTAYAVVDRLRAERPDDAEVAARSEHDSGYRMLFAATILNALAHELAPDAASHAEVMRRMFEAQGDTN